MLHCNRSVSVHPSHSSVTFNSVKEGFKQKLKILYVLDLVNFVNVIIVVSNQVFHDDDDDDDDDDQLLSERSTDERAGFFE